MSTSVQLALFFMTIVSCLGLCVFGRLRARSVAFQMILALLAGFFIDFFVATAISLAWPSSVASWTYFGVFGLAPYLGHVFDPDYTGEEGLVFRMPWVGIWVHRLVTIGFWSLLFGALYFCLLRRWRRTI